MKRWYLYFIRVILIWLECILLMVTSSYFSSAQQEDLIELYRIGTGVIGGEFDVSPDGQTLAVAASRLGVWLYSITTLEPIELLIDSNVDVSAIDWSPDGNYLAVGISYLDNNNIQIWDMTNQRLQLVIEGHEWVVGDIKWSPDGKLLASGGLNDGKAKIWDVETGQLLKLFYVEDFGVDSIDWSPNGRYILCNGYTRPGGIIQIWDIQSEQLVFSSTAFTRLVNAVSWSPDGQSIAASGSDGGWDSDGYYIRVWDVQTGQELSTIKFMNEVGSIAWSPNGDFLASLEEGPDEQPGDALISILDSTTWSNISQVQVDLGNLVDNVQWLPDMSRIIFSNISTVGLWEPILSNAAAQNISILHFFKLGAPMDWSPDGAYLVFVSGDDTLRIWDIEANQNLFTLQGYSYNGINSISWSPDSMFLVATAGPLDGMHVWSMETGQQVNFLETSDRFLHKVMWSPNGEFIASAGTSAGNNYNVVIDIWDVASGQIYRTLVTDAAYSFEIAWSPDSTHLAAASVGLQVWDISTGQQEDLSDNELITVVDWSPDSTKLITGGRDGVLSLWDLINGEETVLSQSRDGQEIYDISWSPSGTQFASVSGTGGYGDKISVWTIGANQQLDIRWFHLGIVQTIAWSPDETRLASVGIDGIVRIWSVEE